MVVLHENDKIISNKDSKEFNQLTKWFHQKNVKYSTLAGCIVVAQEDIAIQDFELTPVKSSLSGKCYEVEGEIPDHSLEYVYIVMKYSRDGETNEIYTSINKVFNHKLTADKYCKEMNDRKAWGTTYEVEEEQIISD